MRILGIDPGSRVTGYAIIEVQNLKLKYLTSGVIKSPLEGDFFCRLPFLRHEFEKIAKMTKIDHLVAESLIHVKNVNSLAKLAQARGAMLSAFDAPDIKFFEYSPNKVKATVSGFGHADKKAIQISIERLFGQKIKCATHDESDALAVAITHGITLIHGGQRLNSSNKSIFSRKSSSLAASINPDKIRK